MTKELLDRYTERYYKTLRPISIKLDEYIKNNIVSKRIDYISTRAKAIDSFMKKSEKVENGRKKYDNPLSQIQDQIGARIVTFYKSDLRTISQQVEEIFAYTEKTDIVPDNKKSFGYESLHYMLFLPVDIFTDEIDRDNCPVFFELQIATLFQHAWAQANHNLGYKPEAPLTFEQERKIAFTAAQAWGADQIFDELSKSIRGN